MMDRVKEAAPKMSGEMLRWLIGAVMAVVIAWFTAQATTERQITSVKVHADEQISIVAARADAVLIKEQTHFEELQRVLARIEAELIRLRTR